MSITERQAKILAAIVKEYSSNGQPVGSEEIQDKYNFGISSATIRNEMAALEKLNYIEQPHTSAGRVPTDIGYRYFVNELMKCFELSIKEQKAMREQLVFLQRQHQELGRNIARLLAQKTDQAAFALLPEENSSGTGSGFSSAGLSNILQNSDLDQQGLINIVQFFENIDEYSDKMLAQIFQERPEALIGKEHRLPQISNYSLVVTKVNLPDGQSGMIGIIGPKSMRYDKNLSILEYFAKLLSGGLLILLITQIK